MKQVITYLTKLEARIEELEKNKPQEETSVDGLKEKLDNLESRFDSLDTNEISDFNSEVESIIEGFDFSDKIDEAIRDILPELKITK